MRKGYPIGLENKLLIGADMLLFTTDFLGQTAMVRQLRLPHRVV
jgi:hypothetical protein